YAELLRAVLHADQAAAAEALLDEMTRRRVFSAMDARLLSLLEWVTPADLERASSRARYFVAYFYPASQPGGTAGASIIAEASVTLVPLPWAIQSAAVRLRFASQRHHMPAAVIPVRHVLRHLLADLKAGPLDNMAHGGWAFPVSELLYALRFAPAG